MSNLVVGKSGEERACQYLKNLGYKILQRNFRIRGGEIDIVAKDGDLLVFVEVKSRQSHEYGLPIESITLWKVKFIIRAAQFYLLKERLTDHPHRIDVITVDFTDGEKLEHIKNITG